MVESLTGEPLGAAATWGDIFPALLKWPKYTGLAATSVDNEALSDLLKEEITRSAVDCIHDFQADVPLSRAVPLARCGPDDLPWDRLSKRPANCLLRQGIGSRSALLQLSVRDLYRTPNAGSKTIKEIVRALVEQVIDEIFTFGSDQPVPDASQMTPTSASRPHEGPGELASPWTEAVPLQSGPTPLQLAYEELAMWNYLVGHEDLPLLDSAVVEGAPDHVTRALALVRDVSAADVSPTEFPSIADVLNSLLTQLEPRHLTALQMRVFAEEPATLHEVGKVFGVTRERVRQIQKKALEDVTDFLHNDYSLVRDVCQALRSQIDVVCSLDRLLEGFPALGKTVRCIDAHAWRVIDQLDDEFDIRDGWAAVPSVGDVITSTREVVEKEALVAGYAALETVARDLHLDDEGSEAQLQRWLDYAGCIVLGDIVALAPLSIPDALLIILSKAGEPLSMDVIMDRLPIDRAPSSVRNVLAGDSRFVRTDREEFGLAEWGGEEYSGIRDMIQRALEESGGEILLEALVEQLTQRFSVAEASVRAYAQGHPFMVRKGVVCVSDLTDAGASKRPTSIRRVYRGEQEWLLRWQLSEDHARGSGYSMPSPLAVAIGLKPGQSLDLASPVDTQSVYWTGLQPAIGSIRRLMEKDGLHPGNWIFVSIADDGFFTLRQMADISSLVGLDSALALVGRESAPTVDARGVLAAALGIQGTSSWSAIVEAARAKGDDDVASAILSDEGIDIAGEDSPEATVDPTDVDEIMRLLQ